MERGSDHHQQCARARWRGPRSRTRHSEVCREPGAEQDRELVHAARSRPPTQRRQPRSWRRSATTTATAGGSPAPRARRRRPRCPPAPTRTAGGAVLDVQPRESEHHQERRQDERRSRPRAGRAIRPAPGPTCIATSVEFGPGTRFESPMSCAYSRSSIHSRDSTTSWRIRAMCAAGRRTRSSRAAGTTGRARAAVPAPRSSRQFGGALAPVTIDCFALR